MHLTGRGRPSPRRRGPQSIPLHSHTRITLEKHTRERGTPHTPLPHPVRGTCTPRCGGGHVRNDVRHQPSQSNPCIPSNHKTQRRNGGNGFDASHFDIGDVGGHAHVRRRYPRRGLGSCPKSMWHLTEMHRPQRHAICAPRTGFSRGVGFVFCALAPHVVCVRETGRASYVR